MHVDSIEIFLYVFFCLFAINPSVYYCLFGCGLFCLRCYIKRNILNPFDIHAYLLEIVFELTICNYLVYFLCFRDIFKVVSASYGPFNELNIVGLWLEFNAYGWNGPVRRA